MKPMMSRIRSKKGKNRKGKMRKKNNESSLTEPLQKNKRLPQIYLHSLFFRKFLILEVLNTDGCDFPVCHKAYMASFSEWQS